jgi:putative lipoic acid-binding regulatory protein
MSNDPSIESLRTKLDTYYDWPAIYPFKFIVPKERAGEVLDLFADDPVRERKSRNGRFVSLTMEMHMHSGDEVIAVYQRVARIPNVISL